MKNLENNLEDSPKIKNSLENYENKFLKSNSTKNKGNTFNSIIFNSIPEELKDFDINPFRKYSNLNNYSNDDETQHRNSIHVEKNVSYFIFKKNEEILSEQQIKINSKDE